MADHTSKGIVYAVATAVVACTAAAKLVANDIPVPIIVLIQYAICLTVMYSTILPFHFFLQPSSGRY